MPKETRFRAPTAPNAAATRLPTVYPSRGGVDVPWPINPEDIEEGGPIARVSVRTTSPDGLLESGTWSCTKGRFRLTYGCDEVVHIVEGEVFIHAGGHRTRLGPGDAAYFPAGLATTWEVPAFVSKVWVMRYADRTPLGRLAGFAARAAGRPAGPPSGHGEAVCDAPLRRRQSVRERITSVAVGMGRALWSA